MNPSIIPSIAIIEAMTCMWRCVNVSSHKILLRDKEEILLGRSETANPQDDEIPLVEFAVRADLTKQCIFVYLVDGDGILNDQEMEPNKVYKLRDGDVIGFSENSLHQYYVSIPNTV